MGAAESAFKMWWCQFWRPLLYIKSLRLGTFRGQVGSAGWKVCVLASFLSVSSVEIFEIGIEIKTAKGPKPEMLPVFHKCCKSRIPTHPWKTWISRSGKVLGKKWKTSWKNPENSFKIHAKLELRIFLVDLYPSKAFFCHKLLSWKILILTLKNPGKVLEKWI